MNELKPCPFCGSEAMISWNTLYRWQVYCSNEDCFMSDVLEDRFDTEQEAVKAWNNRT